MCSIIYIEELIKRRLIYSPAFTEKKATGPVSCCWLAGLRQRKWQMVNHTTLLSSFTPLHCSLSHLKKHVVVHYKFNSNTSFVVTPLDHHGHDIYKWFKMHAWITLGKFFCSVGCPSLGDCCLLHLLNTKGRNADNNWSDSHQLHHNLKKQLMTSIYDVDPCMSLSIMLYFFINLHIWILMHGFWHGNLACWKTLSILFHYRHLSWIFFISC